MDNGIEGLRFLLVSREGDYRALILLILTSLGSTLVGLSRDDEEATSLYRTLAPDITLVDDGILRRSLFRTTDGGRPFFEKSFLVRMTRYGSTFEPERIEGAVVEYRICLDDPIPVIRNKVWGICQDYMVARQTRMAGNQNESGGVS